MMPVVLAALGKILHVGVVGIRPEHARLLAVARDALAAEIAQMLTERRATGDVPDHPRFDGRETRAARQQLVTIGFQAISYRFAAFHKPRFYFAIPLS